jgi:hypothetical protein
VVEIGVECQLMSRLMGLYSRHVFPRLCDWVMSDPSMSELRSELLAGVGGEVLEVGFGTGLNLLSGERFGGTCLYACRDGRWGAYRIRPSESRDIASAEAWLAKRKWRQWGS